MRILPTLILFSISLIACGGSGGPERGEQSKADTSASQPSASQPAPASGVAHDEASAPRPSFDERVFNAYARRASSVPKRVMDSVLHANMKDPKKVEAEMMKIFRRTDTVARATLAAEFNISVDSLSGIIDRMNKEKGGK